MHLYMYMYMYIALKCFMYCISTCCSFFREGRRVCWPFQDHSSRTADPFAKQSDLGILIEQILFVFQSGSADLLLDKWTRVALSVSATT